MYLKFKTSTSTNYVSTTNLIALRMCLRKRGKGRQNCSLEFEFLGTNGELSINNIEFVIISDEELSSVRQHIKSILSDFYEFESIVSDDEDCIDVDTAFGNSTSKVKMYPDLDYYYIKVSEIIAINKYRESIKITLSNNSDYIVHNDIAMDVLIRKLMVQNL